jgi:hypothetical protein
VLQTEGDYIAMLDSHCGLRYVLIVKMVDFNKVKRQEARSRMTALRKVRRSPQAAAALQRRASLVGNGAKWRITNFKQVARAMSQWA